MTNTESGLLNGIIGLLSAGAGIWFGGRNRVSRDVCDQRHKTEDERHKDIMKRFDRLELKIDRINGGPQ